MAKFKETNERIVLIKRYINKQMLSMGDFPWLQARLDDVVYQLSSIQKDLLKIDQTFDKIKERLKLDAH